VENNHKKKDTDTTFISSYTLYYNTNIGNNETRRVLIVDIFLYFVMLPMKILIQISKQK